MPTKSSRAFRTISEASHELDLKPHVLRFWEAKFPDLQPITRGGGRRFYRPEDIDFLRGLRILLHDEKHKIKDVQKLIAKRGADSVVELGQSAVSKKESRPIPQRDLVPERIKPADPKEAVQSEPAPQEEILRPVAQIVTPQPTTDFRPAASAPSITTMRSPVDVQTQAPSDSSPITTEDVRKLEASLLRLKALRDRWQVFAKSA